MLSAGEIRMYSMKRNSIKIIVNLGKLNNELSEHRKFATEESTKFATESKSKFATEEKSKFATESNDSNVRQFMRISRKNQNNHNNNMKRKRKIQTERISGSGVQRSGEINLKLNSHKDINLQHKRISGEQQISRRMKKAQRRISVQNQKLSNSKIHEYFNPIRKT